MSRATLWRLLVTIAAMFSAASLVPHISGYVVIRTVPNYYETMTQLDKLIGDVQKERSFDNDRQLLVRHRKSVPDGYFTELSIDDLFEPRQRRGQPISDYIDEFSADPFEIPVSTDAVKAIEAQVNGIARRI